MISETDTIPLFGKVSLVKAKAVPSMISLKSPRPS